MALARLIKLPVIFVWLDDRAKTSEAKIYSAVRIWTMIGPPFYD